MRTSRGCRDHDLVDAKMRTPETITMPSGVLMAATGQAIQAHPVSETSAGTWIPAAISVLLSTSAKLAPGQLDRASW